MNPRSSPALSPAHSTSSGAGAIGIDVMDRHPRLPCWLNDADPANRRSLTPTTRSWIPCHNILRGCACPKPGKMGDETNMHDAKLTLIVASIGLVLGVILFTHFTPREHRARASRDVLPLLSQGLL